MEFNRISHENGEFSQMKANRFFFGLNTGIFLEIKKVNINLIYLRTNRYNGKPPSFAPYGDNRLDFTVGYRIGKRK